ncbi:hypothetical protein LTS07_009107 [Exophiala sideris]|uniref:DNA replication regulator SLD2 n=1 Tax=Exophiala sideris TaxID=1016849 RepID=A0ABR0J050_9EURO|nr:hypothetical protein LTS07_009107 [Exophiala sideris]KAK5029599.1 hypothetical protein LTR13_008519 [Exophiala sideris]KAK5053388.1 hypothetical protein LTR69_009346 [Exophiala sideris]KAK5179146.1 hypothetical protein LTR44_008300 [Eurotiomycetes sp. CCFEE 6388]
MDSPQCPRTPPHWAADDESHEEVYEVFELYAHQIVVMDHAITLLDTPKKASLQKQADTLRATLKEYERTFAAAHDGRKPDKREIKADGAIATKYTEYNKVRDVLAGKLSLDALNAPQPRARHTRTDSAISLNPHRSRHRTTPSKSRAHPSEFDPYDAPSSISPKVLPLTIGPTPRRDGTVLGIFDMLPPSGSGRSSQTTPSSRKRKRDAVLDGEGGAILAQTPSQRRSQRTDTYLATTPGSRTTPGQRKHSKTPVSESKRFMLDHFFTTPSAVRFSSFVQDDSNTTTPPAHTKTPLRDALLGLLPATGSQAADTAPDATPPYLKRSFSFKERLLSASGSGSRPPSSSSKKGIMSPSKTRTGPRTLRHVQFAPKPLSQMIAELESQKNETRQVADRNDNEVEDDDDDDLEALREMEATEVNVLVDDSQLGADIGNDAPQEPTTVWKKKGQKRTTRRVIMRPVKWKPAASKTMAEEAEDDSEDELALDNAQADELEDEEEDVSRVEETQLIHAHVNASDELDADSDIDYLIAEAEAEQDYAGAGAGLARSDDGHEDDDEFLPELADLESAPRTGRLSGGKSKPGPSKGASEKSSSKKIKTKDGKEDGSNTRMINPNAYSHMNFKSLKIKNKNSKAKGRGRFGRGRR